MNGQTLGRSPKPYKEIMVVSTNYLIQHPCHKEICKTDLLGSLVQLKYLEKPITN